MGDNLDTRLLAELTEHSEDLNSDAVKITKSALGEFSQTQQEESSSARRWGGGLVAGLVGAGVAFGAGRASAAGTSNDIMALQTAASIENLAITVYNTAAALPFVKSGNATVAAFITKTTAQHTAHAQAFNSAITSAGGATQSKPDPKYLAVVQSALPTIKGPADVVNLAITLEDVAAQTYTKYVSLVTDTSLRKLFGSVAPVEAQHRSILLAVQALLAGNAASLIAIPTMPAQLPAAAGSVGFPDSFYATAMASPVTEGALQ